MPPLTKPNPNSFRYLVFKTNVSIETFFRTLVSAKRSEQYHRDEGIYTREDDTSSNVSRKPSPSFQSAFAAAREAFYKPLSSTMYIAGPAMQPGLNRGHSRNHESMERLVVRSIPFPTPLNVLVGDVVAFYNPLARRDEHNIMIRRIAAAEGQEMEVGGGSGGAAGGETGSSSFPGGGFKGGSGPFGLGRIQPKGPVGLPPFGGKHSPFAAEESEGSIVKIPEGHCWVLADNPDLGPPDVIDSRTFGYVPYRNIVGRVVYAAASTADHGPVQNNPESMNVDEPIIEGEIDVEKLFVDEEEEEEEEEEEKEEEKEEEEEKGKEGKEGKDGKEGKEKDEKK